MTVQEMLVMVVRDQVIIDNLIKDNRILVILIHGSKGEEVKGYLVGL